MTRTRQQQRHINLIFRLYYHFKNLFSCHPLPSFAVETNVLSLNVIEPRSQVLTNGSIFVR